MGNNTIHNAGGILISEKRLLIVREKDHEFFVMPGGSVMKDESPIQALIRELSEELNIKVSESDLEKYDSLVMPAVHEDKKEVAMDIFFVRSWEGTEMAFGDIEEIRWVSSEDIGILKTGLFIKKIIPNLKSKNLLE